MSKGSEILLFDGGIGTELYERGFYINRPFEELNLTSPDVVVQMHLDYLKSGAEAITTNTFSITKHQLKNFDIQDQQPRLIAAALENANSARRKFGQAKIFLSIGPIGELVEPLGKVGLDEVRTEFSEIARAACEKADQDPEKYGFTGYIFETFTQFSELGAAIDGIRRVDMRRTVIASISVLSNQTEILEKFVATIDSRPDVQWIGMNCSEGPADLLNSLKKIKSLEHPPTKPILIQPNAGMPRHVNGRYFYMTSPDYMAKYAKRFLQSGAAGIGGCCGTGPLHIQAIRNVVKMQQSQENTRFPVQVGEQIQNPALRQKQIGQVPVELFSKVLKKISEGKKAISVELIPPKGTKTDKFLENIEKINQCGVDFINVPDGARAMTRVSSLHVSAYVQKKNTHVTAIPHFTTRDRNLIALQSDLLGASLNGVHDILMVTGDPPKLGTTRDATAVYDIDSIGLTYLASCLNRGVTPTGESLGSATHFGIGVASNPTAINLEVEIQRWKYKVESGAHFSITQPIFDAESFLQWKDKIQSVYRPHLVGIWPLLSLRNAEFMAHEVPGVFVPAWVLQEMEKAGEDKVESAKRGIGIAQKVIQKLESHCEGFCISAPLGKVDMAIQTITA